MEANLPDRPPGRITWVVDYQITPESLEIFRIPQLKAVKVSFPRPLVQGSLHDQDIHAGQHHVPLASLPIPVGVP